MLFRSLIMRVYTALLLSSGRSSFLVSTAMSRMPYRVKESPMLAMMASTTAPLRPLMIASRVMELMTTFRALYTFTLMRLSAFSTLPERVSMNFLGSSMRQMAKQSAIRLVLSAVSRSLTGRS